MPGASRHMPLLLIAAALLASPAPSGAKGTGKVAVPNEKSSTLTILDSAGKVLQTIDTCARPRGMAFNRDRTAIYVGCGDDNTIALYDIATLRLLPRHRHNVAAGGHHLPPGGTRVR